MMDLTSGSPIQPIGPMVQTAPSSIWIGDPHHTALSARGNAALLDIVILAVSYPGAAAAVADFGKALAGKVIIDITNPIAPDLSGLVHPHGAQETAKGEAARTATRWPRLI